MKAAVITENSGLDKVKLVEIVKLAGAVAIVTSSSDEKLKHVEQIGADCIINYNRRDVAGFVKEAISGRGGNPASRLCLCSAGLF